MCWYLNDAKVVSRQLDLLRAVRDPGPLRFIEYLLRASAVNATGAGPGAQFCEISSTTCMPLFLPALLRWKCERWYWQLMLPVVHDYGIMHRKYYAT